MGPLITATGQGLSFMSHPKDGTSRCRGWRSGTVPPTAALSPLPAPGLTWKVSSASWIV